MVKVLTIELAFKVSEGGKDQSGGCDRSSHISEHRNCSGKGNDETETSSLSSIIDEHLSNLLIERDLFVWVSIYGQVFDTK